MDVKPLKETINCDKMLRNSFFLHEIFENGKQKNVVSKHLYFLNIYLGKSGISKWVLSILTGLWYE